MVEVHGYGGSGSEGSGVRGWIDRGDCIGIAPSFPNDGYQLLGKDSDRQLTQIFDKLKSDFKLHDKLFIYGHSGGAQYAHRFALKYPNLVMACCATSAGTWATGSGFGVIRDGAAKVPIAISCGEKDTSTAAPGLSMNRIVWTRKFEEELAVRHFFYKAMYWPNAGHEGNARGNAELAGEAFSLGATGMAGADRENFDGKMKILDDLVQTGDLGQAMKRGGAFLKRMQGRDDRQTADNLAAIHWSAGPAAITACTQTARAYVADRMNSLSMEVEAEALNQITVIERQAGPDAVTKLQSLCGTFAGWPNVRAAADQAAHRLQAGHLSK